MTIVSCPTRFLKGVYVYLELKGMLLPPVEEQHLSPGDKPISPRSIYANTVGVKYDVHILGVPSYAATNADGYNADAYAYLSRDTYTGALKVKIIFENFKDEGLLYHFKNGVYASLTTVEDGMGNLSVDEIHLYPFACFSKEALKVTLRGKNGSRPTNR